MKTTTISTIPKELIEDIKPNELFFYDEKFFYDKKFYFSYSSLNILLYCPEMFYKQYILGEKDIKDETYLTEGRLIHCLLLEPKKFNEQFIVMPGKIPGENTKIVIDKVFANKDDRGSLADYQDVIIDILKEMNLHQSLKTDEQRFAKIYTPDSVNYWEFLCKSTGKQIVDTAIYEKCKDIVEKIRLNKEISDLLQLNADSEWWSTIEVYNELPVEMDLKKFKFGLKGIIDNLVVDPISKIIRINDFKTTSKTLSDFPETIKFYKYNLQAAIYNILITSKFADLIKDGYKIEFRFVVIDKNQQVYAFRVSENTMKDWMLELHSVLNTADYHYTNKDYTLPHQFVTNEYIL